ncbi:CapA family protein [Psychrobacillus sp. FJAT-21963]|uniref:CapA family protein n=1 Tax=Psychrobacillus sp. FJAT-21963 TaxID=1712028 RepID=UPI0009EA7A0E|nr:CapA family protein [Psychrobacillus sp. FJAT-21963]
MIEREVMNIKILVSFLLLFVSVLSYFNMQITEPFDKEFHGKQFSTFYVDYEEKRMEIGMIGDILLHLPLYNYASFLPSFEPVREKLESLDLLLANQESIPAGPEFGLSGYPNFSSPTHIIRDLKEVGVDMISMANNHTLDQGEAGVLSAIRHMKKYSMPYMGAYETIEDLQTDRILEVENIHFGLLNYTYGMNGYNTPTGKDYLVNTIDADRIIKEIQVLKDKVDFVIVSIHWGSEYELEANDQQKQLAHAMAEAGADIIFGHHPHVIQPYEEIATKDGHTTHVFYSLGNFFSAQSFDFTNIGGIAKVSVLKKTINGKEVLKLEDPSFIATAVIKENPYKVYPLEEVESKVNQTDEWVQEHLFNFKD